jgi:hypothetical protein
LRTWKNLFGIQRDIGRYIIWKFSVKWKVYAEILFNIRKMIIGGFGTRKKKEEST